MNGLVFFRRHAHQSGEIFALSAGRKHDNFVRRIAVDVGRRHDSIFFDFEHAGKSGDFDVDFHTAAFDDDFLSVFFRGHNDGAHTFELRGERADNETSLNGADDFVEVFMNFAFGRRESGIFDVRRVAHKKQNFLTVENRITFFFVFRRHAVDVVEFIVGGNNNPAERVSTTSPIESGTV